MAKKHKLQNTIHLDKIKEICSLPIGGSILIDDYTYNSFRNTLQRYVDDRLLNVVTKSFMIDDSRRIIVRVKNK